jgi:Fe2+ or Zn2+ uptake regulation protein
MIHACTTRICIRLSFRDISLPTPHGVCFYRRGPKPHTTVTNPEKHPKGSLNDAIHSSNQFVSKEWNPNDVFDVLASEHARKILAAASIRPVSAQELKNICDTSLPTVYRRVNALITYDLLSDHLEIESDGTHYSTYTSDLNEIRVRVEDGKFNVNIEIQKDSVDQFGELISDLETGQASSDLESEERNTDNTSNSNPGPGTGNGI